MIVEFRSCSRAASHVPRRATSDGNPSCFLRSRKRRARADKSLESSAPVELVKSTSYGKPTHEPPPKGAHSLQRKGRRGGERGRVRLCTYVVRVSWKVTLRFPRPISLYFLEALSSIFAVRRFALLGEYDVRISIRKSLDISKIGRYETFI